MMTNKFPDIFQLHPDVAKALRYKQPVVALESTVITHGLPFPENIDLARELQEIVRKSGGTPATIALISGRIRVGLTEGELETLANMKEARKISSRDLSIAAHLNLSGGTTVAATMYAAHRVGIKAFATGGIGGVHRGTAYDVSADLSQLQNTPLIVVCSGPKSILDLAATREKLETYGIPVLGYKTSDFPAFYSASSGLKVDLRVDTPEEIAAIAKQQWKLGLPGAVLVVNPPPASAAIPFEIINTHIENAVADAERNGITGAKLTPYLLKRVSELTAGKSLAVNLALLKDNALLAAQIAIQTSVTNSVHRI